MIKELQIATYAAKKAGKLLRDGYNKPIKVNSSEKKDIKLQLDVDSEKIILDELRKNSHYDILSEEAGQVLSKDKEGYKWIIDPLDGSLNFSRSIFINCISIGLWKGNKPILGVIYDFIHDDLYTGIVDDFAKLNGHKISVSDITDKSNSIICTGFPVYTEFDTNNLSQFVSEIQSYKKVRLLGSASISLALVALGSVEAYKEDNIAIWDVAAGIPIVLAAGGKCEISEGRANNLLCVYATNGKVD